MTNSTEKSTVKTKFIVSEISANLVGIPYHDKERITMFNRRQKFIKV